MRGQPVGRGIYLAAGLLIGGFGAYSLLRFGLSNLVSSGIWSIEGVVVHDGVLAPVVFGGLAVGARLLLSWARAPVVCGGVLLGSVALLALLALLTLGRFGAKPDNPSLLDRSYGVGWLVLAGFVTGCVALGCLAARRREAMSLSGNRG